ncbi:MAG: 23S rRNA (adenine(2503)-C(2))-methyltransferase RlmN, partial [Proteobacteria bacterium]|nr:23S rRNA (adenine(2503)-C(2))-methyltransferase RlmN [Pseudomonadota bacterium]
MPSSSSVALAAHPLAFVDSDWRRYLTGRGLKPVHTRALLSACAGATGLASPDLPAGVRRCLDKDFAGLDFPLRVSACETSVDGVVKWALTTGDGHTIECVYIPHGRRATACLSSQAGCGYGCTFCATGRMGLMRSLSVAEIVGQLHLMRLYAADKDLTPVSNVVFMGMGEPLANLEALVPAIELISSDNAYAIARRRITVSTVGLADRIPALAEACDVSLAVSVHASCDETRTRLMPINRRWPLAKLLDSLRAYTRIRPGRSITIEYIMLAGVNDALACARQLGELFSGLPVKFNLIPFNASASAGFVCSAPTVIAEFASALRQAGYVATIRSARGADSAAACGQLAVYTATKPPRGSIAAAECAVAVGEAKRTAATSAAAERTAATSAAAERTDATSAIAECAAPVGDAKRTAATSAAAERTPTSAAAERT